MLVYMLLCFTVVPVGVLTRFHTCMRFRVLACDCLMKPFLSSSIPYIGCVRPLLHSIRATRIICCEAIDGSAVPALLRAHVQHTVAARAQWQ